VYLEDQLGAVNATVEYATIFANPVHKWHEGGWAWIQHYDHHLTVYTIDYEEEPGMWTVGVGNQFGAEQHLVVSGPFALAVPTQKQGHEPPVGLDHFLLYQVDIGPPVALNVSLWDQFNDWELTWHVVGYPVYIGVPVQKTHNGVVTEIVNPEAHLVFYEIDADPFVLEGLWVSNQFGDQTLNVYDPYLIAVPSRKLYVDPMP